MGTDQEMSICIFLTSKLHIWTCFYGHLSLKIDPSTVLKLSMLKVSLKQQQTTKKLSKTLKIDPNFVIRLLIKM